MATIAARRSNRILGLRPVHWLMLGIIATALVYGGMALSQGVAVSYLSVAQAKQSAQIVQAAGKVHPQAPTVQVFGFLHSKGRYDQNDNWVFDIQGEDGQVVTVVYGKPKPANFEEAISVVATGKYDPQAQHFTADSLLVKCPSKYVEEGKAAQSQKEQ